MYFIIQHQFDPDESVYRPYTMSIRSSNKCKGYGTLEEAKKVLEKVENEYEATYKIENEYDERIALASDRKYDGPSHAMEYSIYRMTFALRLKK